MANEYIHDARGGGGVGGWGVSVAWQCRTRSRSDRHILVNETEYQIS